jgi:hypothetical protein
MKKNHIIAAIIGVTLIFGMVLTGCGEPEHDSKPGAPAEISAAAVSSSIIKIDWSHVSHENQVAYYLYRSTNLEGPYTKLNTSSSINSNSFSEGGLSTGTTYYYKVSAYYRYYSSKNGGNMEEVVVEGALSSAASATTYHAEIPTEINASVESKNSVMISWKTVTGVKGYNIYRSSSDNVPPVKINTITSPTTASTTASYTDTGLAENATYYYTVSAYSASGEGAQSSIVSAKTAVPESFVVASLIDGASINLGWYQVPNVQGYKVYYSPSEDGTYTLLKTINQGELTFKTDEGRTMVMYSHKSLLTATYYYTVCAFNKIGEGPRSEPEVKEAVLTNVNNSYEGSINSDSEYNWHTLITTSYVYNRDPGLINSTVKLYIKQPYILLKDMNTDPSSYTGKVKVEIYNDDLEYITTITSTSSSTIKISYNERAYVKVFNNGQEGSYYIGIDYLNQAY